MMAAGPHRAERVARPPGHHLVHRKHTRAGRAARSCETVRIHRGIRVQLHIAFGGRILEYQIHIRRSVHPLQVIGMGQRRLQSAQFIQQPGLAHVLVDRTQASRVFGMTRAHLMAQAVGMCDVGRRHGGQYYPSGTIKHCTATLTDETALARFLAQTPRSV